jgi:hypothetical protein
MKFTKEFIKETIKGLKFSLGMIIFSALDDNGIFKNKNCVCKPLIFQKEEFK